MAPKNAARTNALAIRLKDALPEGSTALALRCKKVGITVSNIDDVVAISEQHDSPIHSIVSLMEEGMTLERVEQCLEISRAMPGFTIRLVNRYLEDLNLQITDPAEIMSVFEEACHFLAIKYKTPGIHFPAHDLFHAIDEVFDGDIQRAYQMANDNMNDFVNAIYTRRKVYADVND